MVHARTGSRPLSARGESPTAAVRLAGLRTREPRRCRGRINGGCNGFGMAFDGSGNLWVASSGGLSLPSNIYEFGPSGGASSTSSLVSTIPFADGTCAAALSFSKDGLHLYLARQFCGNGGDVVEVSPTDGSVVRTLTHPSRC